MKKNYLDIIDPIHDFIRVYEHELSIIDNPIFQRLRRIRQLSGAHLTYPAAQHTRLEHSLGVMHIASQAGHALNEKGILKSPDIQTEDGDLLLEGLTWERSTHWQRDFTGFAVRFYYPPSIGSAKESFINETRLKIKATLMAFGITLSIAISFVAIYHWINF